MPKMLAAGVFPFLKFSFLTNHILSSLFLSCEVVQNVAFDVYLQLSVRTTGLVWILDFCPASCGSPDLFSRLFRPLCGTVHCAVLHAPA